LSLDEAKGIESAGATGPASRYTLETSTMAGWTADVLGGYSRTQRRKAISGLHGSEIASGATHEL